MDNPQTVRDKVRIRFRKFGDLRLVSHHDLLRCFERMLRRAQLPVHSTQGFNPKPRLVFALSLPLGIVGCEEVVELELDAQLPLEEIHSRLAQQTPPGLEIISVRRISPKTNGQVCRVRYRLELEGHFVPELGERAAALLAAPTCWIERTRPQPKRIDIRPYLEFVRILPAAVEMDLLVTPTGTARPEEVLELLGLRHLLDSGGVIERTRLELRDESLATSLKTGSRGSGADPMPRHNEPLQTLDKGKT